MSDQYGTLTCASSTCSATIRVPKAWVRQSIEGAPSVIGRLRGYFGWCHRIIDGENRYLCGRCAKDLTP